MTRAALIGLLAAATACGGGGRAEVVEIAYSSDGRWLALARQDGCIEVRELGGTGRRSLRVGDASPLRIALTEDGSRLAVVAGAEASVWSVPTGKRERTLGVGPGPVVSLKLSDAPEPFLLAAFDRPGDASGDNVAIWRMADGVLIGSLSGSPLATFTHADEAVLLLNEQDAAYEVQSFGGRLLRRAPFPQPLRKTAFAPDGAFLAGVLAAGTDRERVAAMSVSDDQFVWQSASTDLATRQLLFLENPSRVVQLGQRVLVLDHENGQLIGTVPALAGTVRLVAAPDGAIIAGLRGDGTVVTVCAEGSEPRVLEQPAICPP